MRKIAHRSGPVKYPEQTVKSALYALQSGADMAEIDLRFSSDGVPVISHDENTNRLFGIDRKVNELTADEYSSLLRTDFPGYTGHLFEDYVKAGAKPLLLHIKESTENLPRLLRAADELTEFKNITVGVASPEDVKIVKDYSADIPVLAFMRDKDMIDGCIEAGADYIRLWQNWMTDGRISRIHSACREVWIMTGGCGGFDVGETSEEFIAEAINAGADGILINDISKLSNFI